MPPSERLRQLHLRLVDISRTTAAHCAGFRQTIGENREMVQRSIDIMLSAKAAMRCADELLGNARKRRIPAAQFLESWPAATALQPAQSGDGTMKPAELPEPVWKARFAARLAALFVAQGLKEREALADATAHADNRYPSRNAASPEEEAEAEYAALQVESAWA